MANILYNIASGAAPFTVLLISNSVVIVSKEHEEIGSYKILDVGDGIYTLRCIDSNGCVKIFDAIIVGESITTTTTTAAITTTTTTEEPEIEQPDFGVGFQGTVYTVYIDSNEKYLVGGIFINYNNVSAMRGIRLNGDGSRDNTFNIGTGFNDAVWEFFEIEGVGYLVGGDFTEYNGNVVNGMVLLNYDGTINTSFSTGDGFNGRVKTIVRDNGAYIVGGGFTEYDGNSVNRLIKLNSNGTINTAFTNNLGDGFSSQVEKIIKDSNGKYVIVGIFSEFNNATVNRIVRLNSNGTFDSTFDMGSGFDTFVYDVLEDSNEKYLVSGHYTNYRGMDRNRIIRINQDGTIDTSFNPGVGFNNRVFTINVDVDGKYIAGGDFTTYQNITVNGIIRMNEDGSIDSLFNSGTGFNVGTTRVRISHNKYLVGGTFTEYNTETVSENIAILNKDGSLFA